MMDMTGGDEAFLKSFEDCTLPFAQWTHRAHVKVAFLYLSRLPFEGALEAVRRGIKKYNAAQGKLIMEGPTTGDNETTTRATLHVIAAVMGAYGKTHPTPDAESFCETHPQLMSKHVLRLFYSPGRRMDSRAKTEFVEPDLAPLPRLLRDA
jgi:hypothetical protein